MGRVYDKKQERNIQHWMLIELNKFHPESDDKKHPTLDANCPYKFHPEIDDKKHPILDDYR